MHWESSPILWTVLFLNGHALGWDGWGKENYHRPRVGHFVVDNVELVESRVVRVPVVYRSRQG